MKMKKTNWTLASKSTRISGGQPDIQLHLFYFGHVWSEMGYGVRFSRELQECMNVFIVSIPNEGKRKRKMRI